VQQSTGIQQLLRAEKTAAEKVGEARKRKARRLKQAKEEATAEIDAYKAEREKQYREHESKIMGSKGDNEARVAEQTTRRIEEANAMVDANRERALAQLLNVVMTIKPELHRNYIVPT